MRRIYIAGLTLDLTPDQVADLQAQLEVPEGGEWLTADQKARQLGVSRETVYRNAPNLGGQRIGAGPKAAWRFPASVAPEREPVPPPAKPRRKPRRKPTLEVRGQRPYAGPEVKAAPGSVCGAPGDLTKGR